MKKITLILLLLTSIANFSQSYPFRVSGKIVSKFDQKGLQSATVHIEKVKDSTVVAYTISDVNGEFNLPGKTFFKDVRIVVSYMGMKSYQKIIPFDKLKNFVVGVITLEDEQNMLGAVKVVSRAPITIKKDTLEFNVKSFKTKRNATVEDLLEKLPGVEVDEKGDITVNGKPVNNILVNGKPFFGDPKLATKNLTKDIIEKVQIVDSKTKSQAFSGKRGDQNNKTINLTIKKDKNKGWFGRVASGAGTNKHYEAAGLLNRFNDKRRVSILASTNNINSSGFSFGEIQEMFGGFSKQTWKGGRKVSVNGLNVGVEKGLVTSKTGGFTFTDEFKKGMEIDGNYFYSASDSKDRETSNKEYILPKRRYFTSTNSEGYSTNSNHSAAVNFDFEIDSIMLINFKPRFSFATIDGFTQKSESTFNENRLLTNKFINTSKLLSKASKFDNQLDFTKKYGNKGGAISLGIGNVVDISSSESFNKSSLEVFGSLPLERNRNQLSDSDTKLNEFSSFAEYRYPVLANKLFIDFAYDYKQRTEKDLTNTKDFDTSTDNFSSFNSLLSSDFVYEDISKMPSLGLQYLNKKIDFSLVSGYVTRTISSEDKLRPVLDLSRSFEAMSLESEFTYMWSKAKKVRFNYDLENLIPGIRQIQAFSDVTNPSNIIIGNPNLRPTKSHKFNVSYRSFNFRKGSGFYLFLRANYDYDGVGFKTNINDSFIRRTTYANVDGKYNLVGFSSYIRKFKLSPKRDIKIRLTSVVRRDRTISILNTVLNKNIRTTFSPIIKLDFNYNRNHSFSGKYTVNFAKTENDVNLRQNSRFTRHNLSIKTRNEFFKKLELLNELKYSYNPGLIDFNNSSMFWNSSLSYFVIKDKGTVTLKAYDILNQSLNARRVATDNYIEDRQSTVLQQYFMIGFSWKFNTLGTKKKKKRRF